MTPHSDRDACSISPTLRLDERGAGTTEYVVLVGCVALLALGGWRTFGGEVRAKVAGQAACVASLSECAGSDAAGPGDQGSGATPTGSGASTGVAAALTYEQQLHQSLATLESNFDAIAGDDGRIDEDDLQAALASGDPAVRDAAAFLLANPPALHALDVGAGRGDVDGDISLDDVRGLSEHLEDTSLAAVLADTADGDGGRDGDVSRDDLEALAAAPGTPPEIRAWAEEQLASMPEDEGCGGWTDVGCHVSSAAGWAYDTSGLDSVVEGAGSAASWVADSAWPFMRDYTPVGVSWGIVRGVGSSVVNLGYAVTHPVEALQGLNYFLAHPVETIWVFGATSWDSIRENPAQGIGETVWNVGSFFIPGAGSTTAVRVATTTASYSSSVASVSDAGGDASRGDVPEIVSVIDDVAAFTTPTGLPARFWEWAL